MNKAALIAICSITFGYLFFPTIALAQETLVGMRLADAQKVLNEQGIRSTVRKMAGCLKDIVASVDPAEPWSSKPKLVTLSVEDGKAAISTPDLANRFWWEAGEAVSAIGLSPVFVREKISTNNCELDETISMRLHAQSPDPGVPLCKGASVTIFVHEYVGRRKGKACSEPLPD